jgi:hypothetical protein
MRKDSPISVGMKPSRAIAGTMEQPDKIPNEVSDETGQFDPRFLLWRKFCADQDIPVDSLPANLPGELKEQWEKLKARGLNSPIK